MSQAPHWGFDPLGGSGRIQGRHHGKVGWAAGDGLNISDHLGCLTLQTHELRLGLLWGRLGARRDVSVPRPRREAHLLRPVRPRPGVHDTREATIESLVTPRSSIPSSYIPICVSRRNHRISSDHNMGMSPHCLFAQRLHLLLVCTFV